MNSKIVVAFFMALASREARSDDCENEGQEKMVKFLAGKYKDGGVGLSVCYNNTSPSRTSWSIISAHPEVKQAANITGQPVYGMPGGPISGMLADQLQLSRDAGCIFPGNGNTDHRVGGCGFPISKIIAQGDLVGPTCPMNYTAQQFISEQTNQSDWSDRSCSLWPLQTAVMREIQNAVINGSLANPNCYRYENITYCRTFNEVLTEFKLKQGLLLAFFILIDNPFAVGAKKSWLEGLQRKDTLQRQALWQEETGEKLPIVGLSMKELNKRGPGNPFSCIKI